ncbi:hypothetical protein [Meridianimarinicoccus roseus]|uniref:hypothetical protein n=1 Tax=Meridianimarinicoccus roseus TaxID=2072018 RepID=UPI0011B20A70|nr:hypothetical protein [Meridianimarinicoccus roseus]
MHSKNHPDELSLREQALRYALSVVVRHVSNGIVEVVEFSKEFQVVSDYIAPVYEPRESEKVPWNSEDTNGPSKVFKYYEITEPQKILESCQRDRRVAELVIRRLGVNIAYGHLPPKPLRSWLGSHLAGYVHLPRAVQKKRPADEKHTLICGLMDRLNLYFGLQYGHGKITVRPSGDWEKNATCSDLVWSAFEALSVKSGRPETIYKIHNENRDKRDLARKLDEVFQPALYDQFIQSKPYPLGGYYPSLTSLARQKLHTLFPSSE